MMEPAPAHDDTLSDFTSQISEKLKLVHPCAFGAFGDVYQLAIKNSKGIATEVAVKVFRIVPGGVMEKTENAMRRELIVWLRLKHPTMVPLLGTAKVDSPFPALVSQWMPSGTLYMYLEQGTITDSAKVKLTKGVADGLMYLHSNKVVHGDLHPANVLIDGSGNPRLTDFGLATVAGDAQLQLSKTTVARDLDPRWRAPEVIGIYSRADPVRPNFKSDVYSFGGVMFFIVSGDIPWKEKNKPYQIIHELLKGATPARPKYILDDHWNLIQKCWSSDPAGRPEATDVITSIATKITAIFRKTESTIRTTAPEIAKSTIWTTAPEMAQSTIWMTAPEVAESIISTIPPEMTESMSDPTGSQLQMVENHSPSKSVSRTLRLSNIQTFTPKMASKTEHDTALSSDTTGLERRLDQSTPRSHKTIVVFGETGVGKSSLINLMAGEEVAKISPEIQRCTMHWQDYTIGFGGDSYKVFDTMGLEEPELGIKEYLEGVENAYRLIKALDHEGGIDLLLFCIRAGRDSPALQSNYRLFHEFLCEKKVPIFLVITGLERERRMEDWWDRNKKTFEKIRVAGHACITAASGLNGRYRDLYEESRNTVRDVVQKFTADGQKPAWIGADNLMMRLKLKVLREWNLNVKKRNIATLLTKRCRISREVAQQLAGMMKQTQSNS